MDARTTLAILVIDDNPAVRALIRSLVEEVTPLVFECDSGAKALEAYVRTRPDWVLMDIQMGEYDGIAATRAIRQWDPQARVLIITGHGDHRHRSAAADAGASGFMLKDELLELSPLLALWSSEMHTRPEQPMTGTP